MSLKMYSEQWNYKDIKKCKTRVTQRKIFLISCFVVVAQSLSQVWLFATPWTATCQAPLSFTILLTFMSIESVILSNHLILCCPFSFVFSLSSIRVFSNRPALCIRWPKYWSFSISPSNEYLGLISFRIAWFDLLAEQRTLKSSPAPQLEIINSSVVSFFLLVA